MRAGTPAASILASPLSAAAPERAAGVSDRLAHCERLAQAGSGALPAPAIGIIRSPDILQVPAMTARIYKPAKTAMQSGLANTKAWVLDFEPEEPRQVEPLMGWTSSGDMRQQVRLRFASKEEAIAYCERHGIGYQVFDAKPTARRVMSYSDNFAFNRRDAWTH